MTHPSPETLQSRAVDAGQGHLFRFWDELDAARRGALLADVACIDFAEVSSQAGARVDEPAADSSEWTYEPAPCFPACATVGGPADYMEARRLGESLIADGRVAAMVVAGGQGTRLGFDGPKGLFRISPVRSKPLFQLFAEGILATQRRFGRSIAWYVMTSPSNDAETQDYFRSQSYFGLRAEDVIFFRQGVMPALSPDGKILLAEKHRVALSPDGHGGSLTALASSGCLTDMARRGVTLVSYFQVDNPLVRPIDPVLVGLHAQQDAQVSTLTVSKADDLERVGNFVRIGDRIHVIEYTELPDSVAHARTADGRRRFDAANLSIFTFSREFLESITSGSHPPLETRSRGPFDNAAQRGEAPPPVAVVTDAPASSCARGGAPASSSARGGAPASSNGGGGVSGGHGSLPWHRAKKKVSCIDLQTGAAVMPTEPNAIKLERFVFDALPLADRVVLLLSDRAECFSPVKNATGQDSVATARRDMSRRAARWLRACGVDVPVDAAGVPPAPCEISPLVAQDAAELAAAVRRSPPVVKTGEAVYLGDESEA